MLVDHFFESVCNALIPWLRSGAGVPPALLMGIKKSNFGALLRQ